MNADELRAMVVKQEGGDKAKLIAQAFATVTDCPHCGEAHDGLSRHNGHQGRSDYVFCTVTGKPVEVTPRALVRETPEHTHVRAGNLIWPRSVDDDGRSAASNDWRRHGPRSPTDEEHG